MPAYLKIVLLLLVLSGCAKPWKEQHPIFVKHYLFDRHRYDDSCYYNGNLSPAARRAIYPFNIAEKVRVISFDNKGVFRDFYEDSVTLGLVFIRTSLGVHGFTPVASDSIVTELTRNNRSLTNKQVDELTDILYNFNYFHQRRAFQYVGPSCYEPRHAIVFLDKNEKVISFIEICFTCQQIKTSLPDESLGAVCSGKFDLIKDFFKSVGISYFSD